MKHDENKHICLHCAWIIGRRTEGIVDLAIIKCQACGGIRVGARLKRFTKKGEACEV